ncbi:hypothetical protein KC19_7G042700 [Ceratodon purpureus]|uniref:non-specific serine/threonine protein kinase n=1 Tax=Ceratodon purpureus TaxID=3225 RepID=A0A8T0H616_CERPU|nr:hypothetical protein KC19_7G042700 [Ceratodon purpureus]KAG0566158.1 hypothetical protein KC19_7G042700 [Ceratodon purpureus]
MKAMDKAVMLDRNKVHRACAERLILDLVDHPFLPTLYASFQTATHVCLITDFCPGGELFLVLERQPRKHFQEESARFYAAEVVLALEYLHCMGVVYRDLKPENILVTESGHVQLTYFEDVCMCEGSRKLGNCFRGSLFSGVAFQQRRNKLACELLKIITLMDW